MRWYGRAMADKILDIAKQDKVDLFAYNLLPKYDEIADILYNSRGE